MDLCRPKACARCHVASRQPGRRLSVVGHGVRERQLRGPAAPGQRPCVRVILVRRFLCVVCRAVMTVVPSEVIAGRLFSGPAILLGLFLWGHGGQTQEAVRGALDPWTGLRSRGWRALNRWTRAALSGKLWPGLKLRAGQGVRSTARAVVEQVLGLVRRRESRSFDADSVWRAASRV